ncbi:MAG TPA: alpha-galactosidase [Anaerolineales bacterium]|nr:alpha-galactosidase [Anaerolineales bacterium]
MTHILENAALQLTIDPDLASWSVASRQSNLFSLANAQSSVRYHLGRLHIEALGIKPGVQISAPEKLFSVHGPLNQLTILAPPRQNGMQFTLTFALPDKHPLVFWKITVKNQSNSPVFMDQLTLLSVGEFKQSFFNRFNLNSPAPAPGEAARRRTPSRLLPPPLQPAFFANGWQSWSFTAAYAPTERQRRTRLGPLRAPATLNPSSRLPNRPGLLSSEMFGVIGDRSRRIGALFGFLSQAEHFGVLEANIALPSPAVQLWADGDGVRLDPGATLVTDWACLYFFHLDQLDPLQPYLDAVARQHGLGGSDIQGKDLQQAEPPVGWCSWYQFSTERLIGALSAQDVRENMSALSAQRARLPLQVIQIDDGFEAQVGDWSAFRPSFPEGVAPLAAEMRAAGFTPGIWLAPFIVHPQARLAADHPDWLLTNRFGRRVNAGYFWDRFQYALDLTHPAALDYAAGVVRTAAHEWGFPYIKLDFLHAAALPGQRHDPTRTRAQVLRAGLQAVRQAAGEEAFLLGCGCPLGPAIGLVDAMRIGTDTARTWRPSFNFREIFLKSEPDLPATLNANQNALSRAAFHRRWWINDPDCLLLHPDTRLTVDEIQARATLIALTGGSFFLSDHLPDLPPERLRIVEVLLPLIGLRPQVPDWFDQLTPRRLQLDLQGPAGPWRLLALFNWSDQAQALEFYWKDFGLEPGLDYYARDFWRGQTYLLPAGKVGYGPLVIPSTPAHGTTLLAVRQVEPSLPQYLGSDLHISQGLEVSGWDWDQVAGQLRLDIQRPGPAHGLLELALPRPPSWFLQDGRPLSWEIASQGRYLFKVDFEQSTRLELSLST